MTTELGLYNLPRDVICKTVAAFLLGSYSAFSNCPWVVSGGLGQSMVGAALLLCLSL
jgi:hypothetical protein